MEAGEEFVKEKSILALSKEPPIILKTSFQKCPVCLNHSESAREKHLAHLWEFWCQSGWASLERDGQSFIERRSQMHFPLCLPWIWSKVCHQRLAKSQGQRGGSSDGSKRWACQIFSGEVVHKCDRPGCETCLIIDMESIKIHHLQWQPPSWKIS